MAEKVVRPWLDRRLRPCRKPVVVVIVAGEDGGDGVSSTTPSTTSVLRVIEAEALRLLQHYVGAAGGAGAALVNNDVPSYAGILAERFYAQLRRRTTAAGQVLLSDATFAELAEYVRRNVDAFTSL